jgi:hypothetical protein
MKHVGIVFSLVFLLFLNPIFAQKTTLAVARQGAIMEQNYTNGTELSFLRQTKNSRSNAFRLTTRFGQWSSDLSFFIIQGNFGKQYRMQSKKWQRLELGLEHGVVVLFDPKKALNTRKYLLETDILAGYKRITGSQVYPGLYLRLDPQIRIWRKIHLQSGVSLLSYFSTKKAGGQFWGTDFSLGLALRY